MSKVTTQEIDAVQARLNELLAKAFHDGYEAGKLSQTELLEALKLAIPLMVSALAFVDCNAQLRLARAAISKAENWRQLGPEHDVYIDKQSPSAFVK